MRSARSIESLRVEDLTHDFGPDARALDHIDFEVKRGEMLCIIGPSGSGKSTLLAALSGQRKPTRGQGETQRHSALRTPRAPRSLHRPHAAGGGAQSAAHRARAPAPRHHHPPPRALARRARAPRGQHPRRTRAAVDRPPPGRLARRENPLRRRAQPPESRPGPRQPRRGFPL